MCGGWVIGLILLCLTGTAWAQRPNTQTQDTYSFLHVTDTGQTAGGEDVLQRLVQDRNGLSLRPSFVIDTGNLTESGQASEYARVRQSVSALKDAGLDFYAVPGNHDVRWCPEGKEAFAAAFGKLHQSFDRGGVHFILLDSTVLLEHWGHFDKAELDWLARDVKRLRPDTPILLFVHHWLGRETPDKRPVDNEFELWPVFQGRNLMAVFSGHGKADLTWTFNGVTAVMAKELSQGSFHQITVTPLMITIERITKAQPKPQMIAKIPVRGRASRSVLLAGWNDPDVPFLTRRRPPPNCARAVSRTTRKARRATTGLTAGHGSRSSAIRVTSGATSSRPKTFLSAFTRSRPALRPAQAVYWKANRYSR